MARVYDLVKDRRMIYSVDANSTVLEAARFMTEHNIGAVPVLRDGELAGIFSERDIMNRVVAAGRSPGQTRVSEVMTANPRAVSVEETVENCLFIMREFGFRQQGKALDGGGLRFRPGVGRGTGGGVGVRQRGGDGFTRRRAFEHRWPEVEHLRR